MYEMIRPPRWFVLAALLLAAGLPAAAQAPRSIPDSSFSSIIARLSEPSGYFDTDNLISNEDSYLHPVSTLRKLGLVGGTYIGVGPDQNYSYIAAIRPSVAFIVDIRRDNVLEHLLFKSVFALSRNRYDYLSYLFGLAPPVDTTGWGSKSVDSLLAAISRSRHTQSTTAQIRERVIGELRRGGFAVSDSDVATVSRFHGAFITDGPALRFNSHGRSPQSYYPDFARLAREVDRDGKQVSFLANEAAFRVVKDLHARNLIVPIVGDFAGKKSFAAIAAWMTTNNERLSAFYTSNVEQYLYRDGGIEQFVANVGKLPRRNQAVMIRSCFTCSGAHSMRVQGYHAVQMLQPVDKFLDLWKAGQLTRYADLMTLGLVTP
jgi:hypothetical protein